MDIGFRGNSGIPPAENGGSGRTAGGRPCPARFHLGIDERINRLLKIAAINKLSYHFHISTRKGHHGTGTNILDGGL